MCIARRPDLMEPTDAPEKVEKAWDERLANPPAKLLQDLEAVPPAVNYASGHYPDDGCAAPGFDPAKTTMGRVNAIDKMVGAKPNPAKGPEPDYFEREGTVVHGEIVIPFEYEVADGGEWHGDIERGIKDKFSDGVDGITVRDVDVRILG